MAIKVDCSCFRLSVTCMEDELCLIWNTVMCLFVASEAQCRLIILRKLTDASSGRMHEPAATLFVCNTVNNYEMKSSHFLLIFLQYNHFFNSLATPPNNKMSIRASKAKNAMQFFKAKKAVILTKHIAFNCYLFCFLCR